ncbi:MerR family transcriptional regulator [Sabulicella rubraurantiaca]|uniref:MerR family transcriptional regulator n=1 Tax=Sabulicella rubraurantiaca TaxID=2811429 RepID=UPI001A96B965|nr:MerR family transcriptional regulator [Sabulicella rubraurantiaca]
MNIGEAARRSGVNAKMIRHYESIGLVQSGRHVNKYRVYTEHTVAKLRFIRHARELAMPLAEVRALLSLWGCDATPEEVRRRAAAEIKRLEGKAVSLQAMATALRNLFETTAEERPDAPHFEEAELSAAI